MENVEKAVHQDHGGMTVDFVSPEGNAVSVHLKRVDGDGLSRTNAEDRARVIMLHVVRADTSELEAAIQRPGEAAGSNDNAPDADSLAVQSLKSESDHAPEDELQEALEGTFPASDPVSAASNTIPGPGPTPEKKAEGE